MVQRDMRVYGRWRSRSRLQKADYCWTCFSVPAEAAIAQLGERQTEDLKVPGSIPGLGMLLQ